MDFKRDHDKNENVNQSLQSSNHQYDDNLSIDSCLVEATTNKEIINFKDHCDYKLISKCLSYFKIINVNSYLTWSG